MRSSVLLVASLLATVHPGAAGVPPKFFGEWALRVEERPGFPWWDQIKYPVSVSITSQGAKFEDQAGFACEPPILFYDDELDSLIFTHCLPTKSADAIAPFYRVRVDGSHILAETWTYKLLLRLAGERRK